MGVSGLHGLLLLCLLNCHLAFYSLVKIGNQLFGLFFWLSSGKVSVSLPQDLIKVERVDKICPMKPRRQTLAMLIEFLFEKSLYF